MITPILDRIVVKPIVNQISAGGIFIGTPVDKQLVKDAVKGEIISVGPGKWTKKGTRESMWGLKAGDLITHSAVGNVKFGEYILIRRDAVIGLT